MRGHKRTHVAGHHFLPDAEALYQWSLAILQKKGGSKQPAVGSVLHNMAGLYARQNNLRETENLLRRSLTI